jgi:capsular polysaccharide transport system permease protein
MTMMPSTTEISPKRRRVFMQTPRVIAALLMREMTTTFGRSSLGYLWAVIEPIGVIIVFTFAFSLVFKQPPLGDSFPLFYATGYLPFGIYNACQSKISTAISQNKALLFYPAVTYTDVIMSRFLLIALTEMTAAVFVFGGLMVYTGMTMVSNFGYVFAGIGLALFFGTAVGLCNATLFEIFPSWRNIWRIITRPMFFVSAIFYLFDSLPSNLQAVLWWNPLIHVVGTLRVGFYPEYEAPYISWLYVVLLSLALMTIGLVNLRTSNKFIINN